jgi:hypothetical protein
MSTETISFARRIGPDPHEGGMKTAGCDGCPDIWELENGDIAVIGLRVTREVAGRLPATAGCGPDEEVVILPRSTVLAARRDISALA